MENYCLKIQLKAAVVVQEAIFAAFNLKRCAHVNVSKHSVRLEKIL
jgi:hypothetical protein